MEIKEFENNLTLEIAVEILASKISKVMNQGFNIEDEELKRLMKEREKMYSGDKEVIEKIINVYGKEIKENIEDDE